MDAAEFEREVGVAAADDGYLALVGDPLDLRPAFGVFAVDLDGVERRVDVRDGAVPERVGDDGRTPAVVGVFDDCRGLLLSPYVRSGGPDRRRGRGRCGSSPRCRGRTAGRRSGTGRGSCGS
ncbi:hypothetical protein ACFQL4_06440 [Halosimplex aquaticum]